MNTLLADRLRRLHRRFLRAGTRFSCPSFAAVTPQRPDRFWPLVAIDPSLPGRERTYRLGLAAGAFWPLLPRGTAGDFPVKETWLQTEGRIWHGVYFGGVVPGHVHEPPAESADWVSLRMCHPLRSATWPRCLQIGIAEFDRLAADVAGQIALPPPEGPDPRFPPFMPDGPVDLAAAGVTWRTSTDLWLEIVSGMDFVDRYERGGFLIRRLPSDVFTASARAIEALQEREETPLAGNQGRNKPGAEKHGKPEDPGESLARGTGQRPDAPSEPDTPRAESETPPAAEPGFVWLNATNAALHIGVSDKTVRNWIKDHKIGIHGESGTSYKFSVDELNVKKAVEDKKKAMQATRCGNTLH